jgi:hypothetical protein
MTHRPAILLAALLPLLSAATPATLPSTTRSASTQPDSSRFLRYVETGPDAGRLEAAVRTYRSADRKITVHLVSAVHVADPAYFRRLNDLFRSYDAVLYEMVKPANSPPPPPGFRSGSSVSALQRWLKDNLDLDFQLDDVDYTRPNFIHADLDVETFERLMDQRGESLTSLLLRAMLSDMTAPEDPNNPPPTIFDLFKALTASDRPRQLKLLLAKQFNDVEEKLAGLAGSVLLTERNNKALATLRESISSGHKNIAIFYGAGHMAELESRLTTDLGFRPASVAWLTAWDLSAAPTPSTRPATRPSPADHVRE